MAYLKNYAKHVSLDQADITQDNRNQYQATNLEIEAKREGLQTLHAQEKQALTQKYGQDLRSIYAKCGHEPSGLRDWRTERCRRSYEHELESLIGVQERIEIYQEIGLKKEWDMRMPEVSYPSHHFARIAQARHDRYSALARDPKSDKKLIHRELEHDRLVKSYIEDQRSFEDFRKEFSQMNNRHMAESIPVHEKQMEADKIIKNEFIIEKD